MHSWKNTLILFSRWSYNLHTNPLISLHFDDSFYIIRSSLLISDYNTVVTIILIYLNQSVFFIMQVWQKLEISVGIRTHLIRCYWWNAQIQFYTANREQSLLFYTLTFPLSNETVITDIFMLFCSVIWTPYHKTTPSFHQWAWPPARFLLTPSCLCIIWIIWKYSQVKGFFL